MSRIAGTFSAAQRRSSGRPFITSEHDRCAGGRHGLEQGELPARQLQTGPRRRLTDHVLPLAEDQHRDVGIPCQGDGAFQFGCVVEAGRVDGALSPHMSNIDGEGALGRTDARRVPDLDALTGPLPDALQHRHRLGQVVVEDPGPDGVAPRVGQWADHRDRAWARRGAAGRPRCATAPPTAAQLSAPPRGGLGLRGPPGLGPRRRRAGRAAPS